MYEHIESLLARVLAGSVLRTQVEQDGSRLGDHGVHQESLAAVRVAGEEGGADQRGGLVHGGGPQRHDTVLLHHLRQSNSEDNERCTMRLPGYSSSAKLALITRRCSLA